MQPLLLALASAAFYGSADFIGGLAAGRFVAPLLFQTSPRDPLVPGAVGCVLLVVSVAATLLPALRAVRVNPSEALRAD